MLIMRCYVNCRALSVIASIDTLCCITVITVLALEFAFEWELPVPGMEDL